MTFRRVDLLRYGLLGLPLAFVALPLYVLLPNHYARTHGLSLAALGAVLLATRALDAAVDPWIGRWVDALQRRSSEAVLRTGAAAAVVLALGFAALWFPPALAAPSLLAWVAAMLAITYAGYSTLSIAHQAWAARLSGDEVQRSRLTGTREAFALAGVLVASAAPTWLGLGGTATLLAVLLAIGCAAWWLAPRPAAQPATRSTDALAAPLRDRGFLRLLAVFVLNGIASAIPATLVLFFVQDRLQASPSAEPLFLATYFACAAVSVPAWLALVRRIGLARSWLAGMLLATGAFVFAAGLGTGDSAAFLAVCSVSGIALGTDLALPSALLAGLLQQVDRRGQEGAYFGWWNLAAKLNLALAAGLVLPALQWAGYQPGERDGAGLAALTIAYCVLPCVLKVSAAAALWWSFVRAAPREVLA